MMTMIIDLRLYTHIVSKTLEQVVGCSSNYCWDVDAAGLAVVSVTLCTSYAAATALLLSSALLAARQSAASRRFRLTSDRTAIVVLRARDCTRFGDKFHCPRKPRTCFNSGHLSCISRNNASSFGVLIHSI